MQVGVSLLRAARRRAARLPVLALALALLASTLWLPAPPAVIAVPGQAPCTHMIEAEVDVIDTNRRRFRDVAPGSVLCLEAGTRGNIKLRNLHGTPSRPIIVRNADGPVTITGTLFRDGGIIISASTYLRVTGSGLDAPACGVGRPRAEQRCGIIVDGARKGVLMNTDQGVLHDIEIDHVAVLQVSQVDKTRGIAIHPLPGQLIGGMHIHHNYVSNSLAEGIYIGSEPHGQPFETLAKVERVHVHHNLVENTGYDGIKLKVAIRDVAVHDNVVRHAGLSRTPAHEGGIKLAFSVGDYYRNVVIGAVEGIRTGRELDDPQSRYFGNVVVDVIAVGIDVPEDGSQVFDNMVVGSDDVGISVGGRNTVVRNNIVVDAEVPLLLGRPEVAVGNVAAGDLEGGYWDPDASTWLNPQIVVRRLQRALAPR
ncbi:MAG TPA: hypothetical protein VFH63_00740 [candidate division Zixibacteria bacterium]|nr:hypothetical protein [candidate division Zixibacteria bacterium]